ncbi:amino acid adenylation domain-containing protein [Eleftheria terrae]|uniref:amino acid adenylation domain-containing protein n=1 Tax=Eleftheria terrae TaxID=1597781 RepID=UPI00263B8EBE|nr:non-ribosomal peptide synthetase [Eleftheria terrae]WKB55582.1 amino acid adenylation domain-containing protein [Eleftheria terrae]
MNNPTLENMTRAEREAVLLLAKAARAKTKPSARPAGIPARTAPREHWPLSFAQQRLWFIAQMWPAAHSLPFGLRLRGPLDEAALQAALDRIVQRHEALRTQFDVADGQPVQRIAPTGRFTLLRHDLSVGEQTGDAAIEHWRGVEASAPFDLAQGPLVRGRLLRLHEQDHVLLLTMHHIVSDGWSLGVLAHELGELYRAYAVQGLAHQVDPLPPLPVQYADYAVWQREWLAGEVQQRQLAFWRQQLATAPALSTLPTDRPRPAVQDYRGQSLPVEFSPELSAALKALSQRHGTTLYMTLLAAWGALVARLAGQDEVVIGTPVANRTRVEVEPLIGFFVNILALRLDFSDRPSVAQLLAQVREQVLQAQGHQDLPFEQVVEALKPERTLAHNPIFQLTFAWQNTPDDGLDLGGLNLQGLPARAGQHVAQYDVTLELQETRDRIVGTLNFATALFEAATMQRHVGYLEALLRGMVQDEAQAVDAIPIVGEAERQQVLLAWNDTKRPYPQGLCVHELFERRAAGTPGAVAVEHEGRRLSYQALDEQANRLAHQLRALGVGAEDRVALCLRRGPELVMAMLAVLKAGAAYVPLDPAYPPQRWQHMLSDSAPRVVLTQVELAASGHLSGEWTVLEMDGEQRPWEAQPATPLPVTETGSAPERLAYVIYTSGSTGQPNGVMVEHRNLANLIGWHSEQFPLAVGERTSSTAGVAFDACTWEVWPALCMGATLVLPPAATVGDPGALLDWWQGEDLQTSFLVTALADAALSRGQADRRGLRQLLTGGDRLGRLPAAGLPFELVNNYGPTEATVVATSGVSRPEDAVIHIGRPIANTRLYLLDRHGQPVPVGAPGELYIGGVQVARGYLNRPELTRERFVADPFAGEPGARMYKTGDLGRWLPDGTVEYLGRSDHQVKIRGLRIELGEIEAQLARQPGVRESVVLAREDVPGEVRLVAYLVARSEAEKPQAQVLREALSKALPEYMVPAAYVVLEALPLTPNGKVDRRALPVPDGTAFAQRAYEAPQGEVEVALAQIWSELLQVERVGRQDNFFELGGHSLLAVQMISRLRQRLGLEVAVSSLFASPVLGDFAALTNQAPSSSQPDLVPLARPEHLPLSFAQQRLWFIAQTGLQASTAYHMMGSLRLRGALDPAALQAALDRIVQRHEALRTRFEVMDGQPVQRIARSGRFTLLHHDLSGAPGTLEHWVAAEAEAPFDLAQGPLVRGRLLRLGEQDHVLLLTMHHIISDGWSLGVLTGELSELYRAYAVQGLAHQVDPLPALPVQYADYAVWQREWLAGEVQQRQLAFWREQLASAPALVTLPTDRPRPAVQDYRGQSLPVEFSPELSAALKALSQRHGTTLYMTLLAAWGALVARLAGQDEVVIGTPVANRTRAEVEPLIGFFVNTLALKLDFSDRPSVAQLLAQVREQVLQAQSHQDLPFEQVVEALRPQRTLAHSPIFQLMFAWQNAPRTPFELQGLSLEEMAVQPANAKFDLTLELQEAQDRITGTLCFATALFEAATMQRHVGYLEALLRGMVQDEAQAVDAIPIVGEAERQQVLLAWNDTKRPYPQGLCVHELFERRAAGTPEAVAVEHEGRRLSYQALDEQANRLAHQLRALGVGAEDRVALCLRRGPELVMAMLAVLKAGAAYVPLDPAYPPQRWQHMLSDSAPRVVLTQVELAASGHLSGEWTVLEMDGEQRPWEAQPATPLPVTETGSAPERLAYVIYTSGSTGQPNGVMVEHRNLANLIGWHSEQFPLAVGERTSSTAGVAFDACTWEVWPALCMGATLVLPPAATVGDPGALLDWWQGEDLQTSFLVTALADAALSRGQADRRGLRQLLTGGDRLGRLPAAGLPFELVNNYGPTEATVVATSGVSRPEDAVIHIGRPIANTRLYLLDRHGQPVPVGAPGELYIGGVQVARGYLNRPELTRERFVADPFAGEPGARMYKTGDLGRWLPDGTVEYLGRSDHQVKIRGLRIELGEIEAQLARQPGVRESVVLAREDVPGEVRLVAYLVARSEAEKPQAQVLREALSKALPEYMVPAAYVVLEALPLTPNGKVDRRALPVPDGTAFAQRAYEAPQGEVEVALAQIWSELLQVERVGRQDNFFELGGHSLMITRLVDVSRRRGLAMDLRQIFDASTLQSLAAVVKPGRADVAMHATLVPVRTTGSRPPLFCLHEGFGTVLVYDRLARFIDADVPVYSLEACALHEDPPVYRSLPDMAGAYLRQIKTVQPVGPYRLAGWSGGGMVAYEIAHQLLAQGEAVEFLGMIDTYNVQAEDLENDIAQAKHYLIRILEYIRPDLPPQVLRALLSLDDLEAMVAECRRNGWVASDMTAHEVRRRFKVANLIARACMEYVAPALALDVDLYSAQEPAREDRSNGWARLLGSRLKITPVGGTHMSMMQDEALIPQIAHPMNRALLGPRAAAPNRPRPALRLSDTVLS